MNFAKQLVAIDKEKANSRGDILLKFIKWLSIIIMFVLIAGSLFLFSEIHITSNGATFQDKSALYNKMNIIIDTPNVPAKINPIVAIVDASEPYPAHVFNYDRINVEYQLMTATAGGHRLSKEPVYIVAFVSTKGWSGPGGPAGSHNVLPLKHESNTVVDANTGEILFGFAYR